MLQCTKGGASGSISIERNGAMHEPDFWSQCAEAMELSIEGRRLIAEEAASAARELWQGAVRKFATLMQRAPGRAELPPA
jgi:hypothetical protein